MQTLWTVFRSFAVVTQAPITGAEDPADRSPQENSACSCSGFPLAALSILVVYQQYRFYHVHRESRKNEELFKIVTENAADMIALQQPGVQKNPGVFFG